MSNKIKEGLGELADVAERDHEVQMARAELYKIAKYAIKLHDMLKGVSEAEGIEGWQQSKITKAADYVGSVYHSLDYDMKFSETTNEAVEMCPDACCGKPVTECSCGPDCEHCDCYEKNKATNEGKGKLKKGHPNYKKQAAAIAISKKANEDAYKSQLANRLAESVKELLETQSLCPECGNPSYTTLPEEKQKGVDGKVCWKGYKRMGTKKKGGKTVDNCVKM